MGDGWWGALAVIHGYLVTMIFGGRWGGGRVSGVIVRGAFCGGLLPVITAIFLYAVGLSTRGVVRCSLCMGSALMGFTKGRGQTVTMGKRVPVPALAFARNSATRVCIRGLLGRRASLR